MKGVPVSSMTFEEQFIFMAVGFVFGVAVSLVIVIALAICEHFNK